MPPAQVESLVAELSTLREAVEQVRADAPDDRLSIVVFSGDLDKAIATFIMATGAAATGMNVDLFFTFWGTALLRDPGKRVKKSIIGKLFGGMLPNGSKKLGLSRMEMAGAGSKMIRALMKKNNVASLEELIETAGELGVRIHVCTMSMDIMELKKEELIDYPELNYCGVTSFIELAVRSRVTMFI